MRLPKTGALNLVLSTVLSAPTTILTQEILARFNHTWGTSHNITNLSQLEPSQGFSISNVGEPSFPLFGSVSNAGDINGDSFDDIILTNPGAEIDGRQFVGETYVIFGNSQISSFDGFDLSQLDGRNGFVIRGNPREESFGYSVASGGDVNNDGFDDIVVGTSGAGKSYVIFGNSQIGSSGSLELSNLDGSNGFVIKDTDRQNHIGFSVSNTGDINDDGIDDIIIGTSYQRSKNTNVGKDYVIFGNRSCKPRKLKN